MKNSQWYCLLLVITCAPHMSVPFAAGSAAIYLAAMVLSVWREA